VASTAFLVAWWFTFGPVALGGPATFVVVDGQSMEPVYAIGDLVVARARAEYAPGDIAVFFAPDRRRYVIHRLEERVDDGSWLTIGDNNIVRDSWTVPDAAILGSEWFVVPRLGLVLFWVQDHPVRFGAGVAAVVVMMSIGGRRRRLHPDLAAALVRSQRAAWRAGRPVGDLTLFGAAVVTLAVALVVLQSLASVRMLGSIQGTIMLSVAATSVAIGAFLYLRLVEGRGVPEPLASRYALSGIVWDCPQLPDVTSVVEHAGARSLRRFTDEHTGRILRSIEHDDLVTRETYLTIDADGVGHRWVVEFATSEGLSDATVVADAVDVADAVVVANAADVELPVPPPPAAATAPAPAPAPASAPAPAPAPATEPAPSRSFVPPVPSEPVEMPASPMPPLPADASRAEVDARFEEILARLDTMRSSLGRPTGSSTVGSDPGPAASEADVPDVEQLVAEPTVGPVDQPVVEPVVDHFEASSQPGHDETAGAAAHEAAAGAATVASFDDILARLDRLRAGIGA